METLDIHYFRRFYVVLRAQKVYRTASMFDDGVPARRAYSMVNMPIGGLPPRNSPCLMPSMPDDIPRAAATRHKNRPLFQCDRCGQTLTSKDSLKSALSLGLQYTSS